jgi:hypothetical protein
LFCGGDRHALDHDHHCDGKQGAAEANYRAPYAAGRDTSEAAAHSIEPTAWSLCGRLLAAIKARGPAGFTCAEVEAAFDLRHQTASARLWDLHTRAYIRDSGARRPTATGRKAVVWIAA